MYYQQGPSASALRYRPQRPLQERCGHYFVYGNSKLSEATILPLWTQEQSQKKGFMKWVLLSVWIMGIIFIAAWLFSRNVYDVPIATAAPTTTTYSGAGVQEKVPNVEVEVEDVRREDVEMLGLQTFKRDQKTNILPQMNYLGFQNGESLTLQPNLMGNHLDIIFSFDDDTETLIESFDLW